MSTTPTPATDLLFQLSPMTATPLSLVSFELKGSTWITPPPQTLTPGTTGGYGIAASATPYSGSFTYSPDDGKTLLAFSFWLSGPKGLTWGPSATGPLAGDYQLGESPWLDSGTWVVTNVYTRVA